MSVKFPKCLFNAIWQVYGIVPMNIQMCALLILRYLNLAKSISQAPVGKNPAYEVKKKVANSANGLTFFIYKIKTA